MLRAILHCGLSLLMACESPSAGSADDSATAQATPDQLFHTGLLDAFLAGQLDGNFSVGSLRQHGDFGLGAFNHFDGELLMLDGQVYQIRSDGRAYRAADTLRTPYAFVNFFRPDTALVPPRPFGQEQLETYLDSVLRVQNRLLAIKITGTFAYVKARSNPPIYRRPYPTVADVIGQQKTFEHRRVRGTFVGYRLPAYVRGLNIPGYHFHFLTADHQAGGHVLEFRADSVTVQADVLRSFTVEPPTHPDFQRLDLAKDRRAELRKVE